MKSCHGIYEIDESRGQERIFGSRLRSLGIGPKKKNELNDKQELQNLANNVKDSMYQDYKTAYSNKGDQFKEEERSTVSV